MSYKKGYKRTPEQIENWKKSYRERIERLGYRYTEEQKKKISDTCKAKGIRPPKNLGRKHDEETKNGEQKFLKEIIGNVKYQI